MPRSGGKYKHEDGKTTLVSRTRVAPAKASAGQGRKPRDPAPRPASEKPAPDSESKAQQKADGGKSAGK